MRRGDVFALRLRKGVGHEQYGRRYGHLPRSVVMVAPTSRRANLASFCPEIGVVGEATLVLIDHLGAVDVSRLGEFVGRITAEETWGIDSGLRDVLDLCSRHSLPRRSKPLKMGA